MGGISVSRFLFFVRYGTCHNLLSHSLQNDFSSTIIRRIRPQKARCGKRIFPTPSWQKMLWYFLNSWYSCFIRTLWLSGWYHSFSFHFQQASVRWRSRSARVRCELIATSADHFWAVKKDWKSVLSRKWSRDVSREFWYFGNCSHTLTTLQLRCHTK